MQLSPELRHLHAGRGQQADRRFPFVVRIFQLRAVHEGRRGDYRYGRGKKLSYAQLGMAIMRNFDATKAPQGFPISQIINLFKPSSTNSNSDRNDRMTSAGQDNVTDNWRVLCVEGMWFQDLFNYDFRRTE